MIYIYKILNSKLRWMYKKKLKLNFKLNYKNHVISYKTKIIIRVELIKKI